MSDYAAQSDSLTDNGTTDESGLLDMLRLNLVPGVGPRMRQALLDRFGDAGEVLKAKSHDLRHVPGIGPKLAMSIMDHRDPAPAERELVRCRELGIKFYVRDAEDYPKLLSEIFDPPTFLYCQGAIEPRDELSLAIVGSRRCTPYGLRIAEKLATTLAMAGVTIVSGLARGIDGAAHRGAIKAGGRTLAVLGTGLASIYPPEHALLAKQIAEHGGAHLRNAARSTAAPWFVPPTKPDHQRPLGGRLNRGSLQEERRAAHRQARHGARSGSHGRPRPHRQRRERRLQ